MNRLLFAAARGARIEYKLPGQKSWVVFKTFLPATERDSTITRIHPDDAHLQYGPISTALRKDASEGSRRNAIVYDTSFGTWGVELHDWNNFRECDSELHRSLFLLILAEALADDGL